MRVGKPKDIVVLARMANYDVDRYLAVLNFRGEKGSENDYSAGGEPNAALEKAKQWVEREARTYVQKNPGVLEEGKWDAGSITTVFVDEGPAESPTAVLYARSSSTGVEFDWDE